MISAKVPVNLTDIRDIMSRCRIDSLDDNGVYIDRSPPGTGKSNADMSALRIADSSLIIVPTHKNCRETVKMAMTHGVDTIAYPKLTAGNGEPDDRDYEEQTCRNYDEAKKALESGLPVSTVVCPECVHRKDCVYREYLADAESSPHRVCTHRRAATSFNELTRNVKYIAIHEDVTDVLRPTAEAGSGFEEVSTIAFEAKRGVFDHVLYMWLVGIEIVSKAIIEALQHADTTSDVNTVGVNRPGMGMMSLWRAMKRIDLFPSADAMRIVTAAASGELSSLMVRVDEFKGEGGKKCFKRQVLAVWQNITPASAACWLSDATITREAAELLVGGPVKDSTPTNRLPAHHEQIQVPLDITKRTSPKKVIAILRAILIRLPQFSRVGIITHREFGPALKGTAKSENLDECFRQQIAKVEHFGGGESRGSNTWLDQCDCLIILGTPRVPPHVVKTRLIQLGLAQAAVRDGSWTYDYWSAVTPSGKRRTVKSLAYRDHDWHEAHRSIVAAELTQAVGRGRAILNEGIPCVVCSTEELDLPVTDHEIAPLTDSDWQIIQLLNQELTKPFSRGSLTKPSPRIYCLGKGFVSSKSHVHLVKTSHIATLTQKSEQYTRRQLDKLCVQKLVMKQGERSGWGLFLAAPLIIDPRAGGELADENGNIA